MSAPGRSCPLHYRYAPTVLARSAEVQAETLYVIGGLYGNVPALQAIAGLAAAETGPVTQVFNGDFNWFNVDAEGFRLINESVLRHIAIRGNVETELAEADAIAGCGCAYPDWVEDGVVARSNAIMQRLRLTARRFPALAQRLRSLPMHLTAQVGGLRIGIVHGDAESLAGWGFSWEALSDTDTPEDLRALFEAAGVRVFACTHTCLPVLLTVDLAQGQGLIVNNGAAGMPNFRGSRYGLLTRISTRPAPGDRSLYGIELAGVHIDALSIPYDHQAWRALFLANWPPYSPAYQSYYRRIEHGPAFTIEQAAPPGWNSARSAARATAPPPRRAN